MKQKILTLILFAVMVLPTTCFAEWHYLGETSNDIETDKNDSWYIQTDTCYYSHKKGHCEIKCVYPDGDYVVSEIRIDYDKNTLQFGPTREYNTKDVEVDYDSGWEKPIKVKVGNVSQSIVNTNWYYGRRNVIK